MSFGEAQTLNADQTDLNVAMFIDPRIISKIERRIRDNKGINEKFDLLGPGRGVITTQRVRYGFFSRFAAEDLNTSEKFQAWVEDSLEKLGFIGQSQPEKLSNSHSRTTLGFRSIATTSRGSCFVARAGYRFSKITIYDNDENQPDTVVEVIYCAPTPYFDEFNTLMSDVSITQSSDSLAIRQKLSDTFTARKPVTKQQKASAPPAFPETHPLAINWEGFASPIAGLVEVEQRGGTGKIRITLPNGEGICSGSYSVPVNRIRSWAIACSNGLTASGSSESTEGATVGAGRDSRGRAIHFSVGS